jgi:hypothetical protein
MLPVAEEYKKVLLVEPAVADAITGERWNRYIFRTGRSSSQDAIANAVAVGKKGTSIATLAQDYAFGRDGVKAFKEALAGTGAEIVHEEYAPQQTTDFTAPAERLFNALKDRKGRKVIFIIWAGGNPFKIADLNPAATASRLPRAATSCRPSPPTRRCPAWKAPPTTTTSIPRTRSTSGWWPSTRSVTSRRPTSSRRAACRPASP